MLEMSSAGGSQGPEGSAGGSDEAGDGEFDELQEEEPKAAEELREDETPHLLLHAKAKSKARWSESEGASPERKPFGPDTTDEEAEQEGEEEAQGGGMRRRGRMRRRERRGRSLQPWCLRQTLALEGWTR